MVSHKDQKGACIKNSFDEVKRYQVTLQSGSNDDQRYNVGDRLEECE